MRFMDMGHIQTIHAKWFPIINAINCLNIVMGDAFWKASRV